MTSAADLVKQSFDSEGAPAPPASHASEAGDREQNGAAENGRVVIRRGDSQDQAVASIRIAYGRCHPEDTFDDLKRRARFSKEAKGLLRDWLAIADRA